MLKILFMGTPDFARESLEAIYNTDNKIVGVVTNVDKPKGRGMKMQYTPVKEFAISKNLDVYQPEKVKNNTDFIEKIKSLEPDVICVVAYGKILPKEILEIPKYGCINVHGSILPKYRGAAPIQWAVINGDTETGCTTMYMNEGMDTGDIILKEVTKISEDETTGELWDRLSKIGAELLVKTLKLIEEGKAPREKQGDDYTMAPMLTKEMAEISFNEKTALEIKNLVRGLNPIMGAYTYINNKKYKFWKVSVLKEDEFKTIAPDVDISIFNNGDVLLVDGKKGLFIKAIDGIISVLEIQAEGSKRLGIFDFLRGNKI